MKKKQRESPEMNSSSMADIAFLLLIFFLVTTTIANDKGLFLLLPPDPDQMEELDIKIPERNLFKIQINSADLLLVENKPYTEDLVKLREQIKDFVLNNGADPNSSDNPQKAIVSLKTDRGTTQRKFIEVLDVMKGAYHDIYAERAGVDNATWRKIADTHDDPKDRKIYDRGRGVLPDGKPEIPMNISIADPTKIGG